MAIRRRTQRGHRFTESPVLQLALQGWRSRMVGLLLMGAFAALVGRSSVSYTHLGGGGTQSGCEGAACHTGKASRKPARRWRGLARPDSAPAPLPPPLPVAGLAADP